MEQHEPQEGTPSGQQKPQEAGDVSQELSELEQVMRGVRDSIERIKRSAGISRPTEPAHGATERETAGPPAEGQDPKGQGQGGEGARPPEQGAEGGEGAGEGERAAGGDQQEPGQQGEQAGGGEEAQPEEQAGPEEEGAKEAEDREETVAIFDGTDASMGAWKKVGSGELSRRDDGLYLKTGRDRGLAYYSSRRFDDFRWKAQYRLDDPEFPMSAAVRFLDPEKPVADRNQPEKEFRYDNQAYVAAHTGFEVRLGSGPGGEPGTFVDIPVGEGSGQQRHPQSAELKRDDWNEVEVEVRGNDYTVRLNGVETARFTNADAWRGKPASSGDDAGYVGILAGEQPRAGRPGAPRHPTGPLGLQIPGAVLPGRAKPAPSPPKQDEAKEAGATFRRIEVRILKPEVSEEKKKLARKDLAAIHEEVLGALARLKAKDRGIEGVLKQAYGYAVLPSVGRASIVLGVARGYGEVFEQGKPIGFTRVTQLTLGVQVGGQTFTQLLLFGSKESLEAFKHSPLAFNGNFSAAFIRGASGTTNFKDVTVHAYSRGGMLLEASLGGQKFRYLGEEEAAKELAKKRERAESARAKIANVGQAAKSLAGTVKEKAGGFLKKHLSS